MTTETYYALRADTGEMTHGHAFLEAAARALAQSLGAVRSDLFLTDRSSSCGTVLQWEVTRDGAVVGTIGSEESAGALVTEFATTTEYGADGPYTMGMEYIVDPVFHGCREVRRPVVRETFAGYALVDGVGQAVTRVSHDGPMSQWRVWRGDRPVVTEIAPTTRLSPLDEEHGWTWGKALEIASTEPVRWFIAGREISEDEARVAMEAYAARQATS